MDIQAAVDQIEAILHPRGRCAVCGGGEFYWKHLDEDADHRFVERDDDGEAGTMYDEGMNR